MTDGKGPARQGPENESKAGQDSLSHSSPFGEELIQFPVAFELRVIYVLALGATLEEDLLRLLQARKASPSRPESLQAKGAKYGRMAVKVVFADQESMRAAYAEIAALPCVKAVL